MTDMDYYEDVYGGECWNCDGEGYVYGCSWDWQCDTWDGDSCLCSRPCFACNPPAPETAKALGNVLSEELTGETNE